MSRSRLAEAALVGCLAAGASFCAFNASGGEAYSIVAQSTRTSAATGRRPLAERIAAANLPLVATSPASDPATPPAATKPSAEAVARRATSGEDMAVATVRAAQVEAEQQFPVQVPAAKKPPAFFSWPFAAKQAAVPGRTGSVGKDGVAPPGPRAGSVARGSRRPSGADPSGQRNDRPAVRQANASSSGKGLSGSSPASVTR